MELNTERLNLVPFSENYFNEVYNIFTNEYVRQYLFDNGVLDKDEALSFLTTSQQTFNDKQYGLWVLKIKGYEKLIGFAGLWHFFEEPYPQLLYTLLPNHTKKGYAIEASLKIIEYALNQLGFPYLDASCDTPNLASHKTSLAIGMKKFKEEDIHGQPTTFFRINSVL